MDSNSSLQENIYFRETQRFRQPWIWIIVLPITVLGFITIAYTMVMQLILGNPVGDRPMPDNMLIWFGPLMLLIIAGVPILLYLSRLEVQVDAEAIHIRFTPFLKKNILVNEIASWQARKYKPLLEYGGWGIRWGPGGKAYNVSGNWGVQLQFTTGKKLLIGSQMAQDFAAAIEKAKRA